MNRTEANIEKNRQVWVTVGSSKVEGFYGQGTGFLIESVAAFLKADRNF